jgi:SAM-dependent methyltransferase
MDHAKTADHWDRQHFDPIFLRREWSFHPVARKRLHKQLGAPSRERWFHDRYLKGREGLRALGVGVGRAETELNLLALGGLKHYDLYDLSPVAIEDGRKAAASRGLSKQANFVCGDIGEADLDGCHYDLITFIASLHHMDRLDAVLRTCDRVLAPGGLLWAVEYIGPDRFQYPEQDAAFPKALYRSLDSLLKLPGEPELKFPSREDVIGVDPTEAVHSSEIVATMRSIWSDLEVIGTYGTLMFMISWCLDYNAWYETAKGGEAFETIMEIDAAMIDSGRLPHYFAYLVARKK